MLHCELHYSHSKIISSGGSICTLLKYFTTRSTSWVSYTCESLWRSLTAIKLNIWDVWMSMGHWEHVVVKLIKLSMQHKLSNKQEMETSVVLIPEATHFSPLDIYLNSDFCDYLPMNLHKKAIISQNLQNGLSEVSSPNGVSLASCSLPFWWPWSQVPRVSPDTALLPLWHPEKEVILQCNKVRK